MNKLKNGLLITVEGPNGTGKSTFIHALQEKLSQQFQIYSTCEPSRSALGDYARHNEAGLCGLPYAYLICANRCEHVENEILPHLENGDIVISDRYIESSMVYQKFECISYEKIWDLNKDFPIPDLSILLLSEERILNDRLS